MLTKTLIQILRNDLILLTVLRNFNRIKHFPIIKSKDGARQLIDLALNYTDYFDDIDLEDITPLVLGYTLLLNRHDIIN